MNSEIINRLEAHITAECSAIDREARFDEMLDECYSFDSVGGPFAHMSPSRVLKEMDPIAYRCGVNDYEDGEGWVEVDGESYDQREAEKAKDSFLDDLNSELSDLQSELSDEESEEDPNIQTVAQLKRQIAGMEDAIAEVEKHSF